MLCLYTIAFSFVVASPPTHSPRRHAAPKLWGGDLADEAIVAVKAVQRAMRLCQGLACDMEAVESESTGKEMDACDTTAGVSFIKEGDSTPVTAADFAIQGMVSQELRKAFPNDRFMGEEDASDLRDDEALRSLAMRLCGSFGDPDVCDTEEVAFLSAIDRGLEKPRGQSERVWVLDPIDGTKGFMTGEGYVIGLALVDGTGDTLIGVMGVPSEEETPPIMAAVKGCGLKWYSALGDAPIEYDPPKPSWADTQDATAPPWLISPQKMFTECQPFGPEHAPKVICCGAMIKYFATVAGRGVGFIQYEESLKSWDHACGLICVQESGGEATDCDGGRVLFPDRQFAVKGGIVCSSKWASESTKGKLLAAAKRDATTAVDSLRGGGEGGSNVMEQVGEGMMKSFFSGAPILEIALAGAVAYSLISSGQLCLLGEKACSEMGSVIESAADSM